MKQKQLVVLLTTIVSLFGQYRINAGRTSLKPTPEVAGREEVINDTLSPDFSSLGSDALLKNNLLRALHYRSD